MKGTPALLLLAVTLCQGAIISRKECSTDSQYKLFPHENCNQYYQCVNGALIVRDCPSSLYFNSEIESCDWKTNVDCSKDEDNEDLDSPMGSCSSGQAEGQFFVHENCNQYYWCVHGNLIEVTCNQGLLFSHNTLRCDWAQNVDCKAVTLFPDTETPDYTENPITETENPDTDITPSPDNCDDSCGDKSSSNEDDSDESSNESDSDESDSDEDDSSEEASDEETSNENSSNENNTDEVTSTEEASDEKDIDVNDSEEDDSNQDYSKEDDSSEEYSGNNDSNEDDSYEADVNKVCAVEGSDGVLIAHEDCSKFYKCSGGKPVVKNCPSDLLFNPDTEQCDWPKNVECGKNGKLYLKKKLEVTVDVLVRGKKYA